MRRSQLFTKTRKQAPADETSANAQLLIRAGFVHKEMAGVYAYLPLGLQVIENIKTIVREEMNAINGQELIMTSLQKRELWEKTDRWDDDKVDVWFKSVLKNGTEVGFGWSHEEQITEMMKNFISSYHDLPISVYQFQTKLRNELRAKSGIMRGREFVMKDMYTYATSEEEHQKLYDAVTDAYLRIFKRVGLGDSTYLTFASGGAFTQFSHEFQTVSEAGEDIIYIDSKKNLAINQEVLTDDVMKQLGVKRADLQEAKAAEVGNIFSFGGTKSEQLGLYFTGQDGNSHPVILGSYGIGITRLMGVIVEHFSDKAGIIWPEAVAPYKVYLAQLGQSEAVKKHAEQLYGQLCEKGISVLWDDRDARAGEILADADLIGLPWRIVVSERSLEQQKVELKSRRSTDSELVTTAQAIKRLA